MKRTRIAPTPSGYLHIGNAFNFLVTDRLAKSTGSALVLRIDDLDAERTRPDYVEDIFRSLEWLRIHVDEGPSGPEDFRENWSQHQRLHKYTLLADELRSLGALYPCPCSRPHFEQRTRSEHNCRVSPGELEPIGVPWRLRIPETCAVRIHAFNGRSEMVDLARLMPDPIILQRETGRPAYQLASFSDDLDMGIDFIVRGADLLPSTACQLHLAELLGSTPFRSIRFHHHDLARDGRGQKLSKSAGAASLKAMRESGVSPDQLIANAAAYAEALLRSLSA